MEQEMYTLTDDEIVTLYSEQNASDSHLGNINNHPGSQQDVDTTDYSDPEEGDPS